MNKARREVNRTNHVQTKIRTEHDSRFPFVFQPGLMSKTEQSIAVKILLHNFTIK